MPIPPDTERLRFRNWKPEDIDAFHRICSDPGVMTYVGEGNPWSRESSQQFIERAMEMAAACGYCQWPLIHKKDSKLIGYCGFVNTGGKPEIGWRLAADYWRRGLATEAARTVLQFGFETLGFNQVIATVQGVNWASIRVVEKLGMSFERRISRPGPDVLIYSVETGASA